MSDRAFINVEVCSLEEFSLFPAVTTSFTKSEMFEPETVKPL